MKPWLDPRADVPGLMQSAWTDDGSASQGQNLVSNGRWGGRGAGACAETSEWLRWRYIRGYAVALSVALLAGCVHFEARPLKPEESATRLEARSLADPALRDYIANAGLGGFSGSSWNLEALTLAALYFHPELDVARAQWAVAEAGRVTAGERLGLGVGVTPGYNSTTATPSPRIVTANADLGFETGGKRGYRIAQAAQVAESARLNVATVAWQVQSLVRSTLLDLYAAHEAAALLAQQQAIHVENLRILQSQYDAGAISAFEVTQARLAADAARLALHDIERQRAEAHARLADAVGVPASALENIELSFDGFETPPANIPLDETGRRALLSRPDILRALAEYAASQSALQLEVAKQYPDLHLGPGYEYDQGDDKWSLGLAIALPANRNRGAIAEAEARRAEAAARFDALQARVLAEVELATAGYRAALRKQADASAMLADLARQERVGESMLGLGEISRGDLAALQLQLNVSALAGLDGLVQAHRAAAQLDDAIQGTLDLPAALWQTSPRTAELASAAEQQ